MIPVWAALAGAGLGVLQGQKSKKDSKKHDEYRRAVLQYSPWTGMSDPGEKKYVGPLTSAARGALTGYMAGSLMAPGATEAATAASAGTQTAAAPSYLGGADMAAQLGAQGNAAIAGLDASGAASGLTSMGAGMGAPMAAAAPVNAGMTAQDLFKYQMMAGMLGGGNQGMMGY